jgi:NitT/TauT family transport system substrate-binding protein
MRIAAVDLISNTCFPLLAADELGLFEAEGLRVEIELLPMLQGTQALYSGAVDLMAAGSVYDLLTQFKNGKGLRSSSRSRREHRGC